MKIYIDADACPVVDEVVEVGESLAVEVIMVCDDCHVVEREGILTIVVEKGSDSADYKILSLINAGDVVVTNDYGLSALALSKKCIVIDFDGKQINDLIIDSMLETRALNAKLRKSKIRTKGPSKRSAEQNEIFIDCLYKLIEKMITVAK